MYSLMNTLNGWLGFCHIKKITPLFANGNKCAAQQPHFVMQDIKNQAYLIMFVSCLI